LNKRIAQRYLSMRNFSDFEFKWTSLMMPDAGCLMPDAGYQIPDAGLQVVSVN